MEVNQSTYKQKQKWKNITLKKPEQRKISQTKKFFKDNIRGIVPKQRFLHLLLGDVWIFEKLKIYTLYTA